MADIKAEYLACPIRQVVSRFGDKWSMLVLFLLDRSDTGIMRFNEIRRFMPALTALIAWGKEHFNEVVTD